MTCDPRQPSESILIGPGLSQDTDGWPDREVEPDPPQVEGRRLVLRLLLAFLLIVGIAIICFVLLPLVGIPVWVPLAAFGVMAFGVLLHAGSEGQFTPSADRRRDEGCGCDGRPVGCCPGPRPPRFLRDPPRE